MKALQLAKDYLESNTIHDPELIPKDEWIWWVVSNMESVEKHFGDQWDHWGDATDMIFEVLEEWGLVPEAPGYQRNINPVVEEKREEIIKELKTIFGAQQ